MQDLITLEEFSTSLLLLPFIFTGHFDFSWSLKCNFGHYVYNFILRYYNKIITLWKHCNDKGTIIKISLPQLVNF
jgi:hypothetical protein